MVGEQEHRGLRTGQIEEASQQHVVEAVHVRDHGPESPGVVRIDVLHGRWMIFHEAVAEVVDRVVVHGQQVPVVSGSEESGGVLDAGTLGQLVRQKPEPRVLEIGGQRLLEERQHLL